MVGAENEDSVATLVAEVGAQLVDAINVDFEDSVLLIGRILGEDRSATAARVTGIDRHGIDLDVGGREQRVDFLAPVDDPAELTAALFALVQRARSVSGEPGSTSAERMAAEMTGIRTFLTEVTAVAEVHPHLRRITFSGGDLNTFSPLGPDTYLYVLLPPPGRDELTIDQSFSWETVGQMPPEDQPVGAYYTAREWRPEVAELDMLFVLHGDSGPASAWALRAKPGDPVALWGPRTSYHPPADTDWYLLVADETGLPATACILESLPPGTPARVFAEVDGPDERQELPSSPGVDVTWLYREGAEPGTTSLLVDAVRALPWPGGTPYVWGGGESRNVTAVRRYVRREVGLPQSRVSLVGYWRRSGDNGDDGDDGEG
jgi:NADPH-dependent ferric siderophore reductase